MLITSTLKAATLSLLSAALLSTPIQLHAQATNKPAADKKSDKKSATEAKQSTSKPKSIPFHGNLVALDKSAKTISVDKRVFQVTSETKIFKGDKPATLDEGTTGEVVTGSYIKGDDGKLTAHSVYFGGKPKKPETKPADAKKPDAKMPAEEKKQ
jgi:hypothetical protein